LLNYNAYGDTLSDLHFHPDALYEVLREFREPLQCRREAPEISILRAAYEADKSQVASLRPIQDGAMELAFLLPAEPWARRIHGTFANSLTEQHPHRAVAVLVENTDGTLRVSVRAPRSRPSGADRLCRAFPTGGGRALAAGISRLPRAQLDEFLGSFAVAFGVRSGP